jgi:hypothetical protein
MADLLEVEHERVRRSALLFDYGLSRALRLSLARFGRMTD